MSRLSHPQGSGRDARTSRLESKGPLRGARWVVRSTPDRLARIATGFLEHEGFETRDDGFADTLSGQGSEWTAVALEIGDEKRSKATFWTGQIADEVPFPLPRVLRHVIPPTLVVVAARRVASGIGELVVFPHASARGDARNSRAAAPRVTAALEQITASAGAEGAMLSHESLSELPDDGCPASQAVVRDVLGWR